MTDPVDDGYDEATNRRDGWHTIPAATRASDHRVDHPVPSTAAEDRQSDIHDADELRDQAQGSSSGRRRRARQADAANFDDNQATWSRS